ncbi:MAG: DUF559 domain-containing protein [Chloroflexi bacterium]|nr:DUF559 domain-containing protein [Chloroflexota bacterium]
MSNRGFIVDFYCHKARLVIGVDGDIHDLQQEEDAPPLPFRHLLQIPSSWNFGGGWVGETFGMK